MIPRTPEELYATVFLAMITRLYGDVTTEARRRRLTEHDIATIERKLLELMGTGAEFAQEIKGFEAEPVMAKARNEIQQIFAMTKAGRVKQIMQK